MAPPDWPGSTSLATWWWRLTRLGWHWWSMPDVLAVMQLFPETFVVVEAGVAMPGTMAERLDRMTVTELQDLASTLNLPHSHRLRKQDLIETILAAQGLPTTEEPPC